VNRRASAAVRADVAPGPAHSVAVVVPAYNEAAHIQTVLRTIPDFVETVICVDDASSDATAALAREVEGVTVVRHRSNRGVGAALVTGYKAALELGADVVAVMAGDGQMAPDELEQLIYPITTGALDYVKGNRLAHPSVKDRMPLVRRVGTQALAALTRAAAGGQLPPLSDAQCGYTAISAEALRRLPLERLYPRYGYPNDLLVMLAATGARVGERVVSPVYADEASGLRPGRALFTHSYVLARAFLWRIRTARQGR